MEPDNPLMRKKKTPEELAKEAEEADLDDLTSELPALSFITYRPIIDFNSNNLFVFLFCRVEKYAGDSDERDQNADRGQVCHTVRASRLPIEKQNNNKSTPADNKE